APGSGSGGLTTVRVQLPPSAPLRKGQRLVPRSAGLGDQIVGNFKGKNQLAILCPAFRDSKRKFFHS
ncbi:MAG: hypothetical protein KAJ59_06110, partial [Thermodesulfovibrionia bacterium]|nr:hypothetical protein [Thermodesulfovibrionia bacterium]